MAALCFQYSPDFLQLSYRTSDSLRQQKQPPTPPVAVVETLGKHSQVKQVKHNQVKLRLVKL